MSLLVNSAQNYLAIPPRSRSESVARASEIVPSQRNTAAPAKDAQAAPQFIKSTRKLTRDTLDDVSAGFPLDRYSVEESLVAGLRSGSEVAAENGLSNDSNKRNAFAGRDYFDEQGAGFVFEEAISLREETPLPLSAKVALSSYVNVERINYFSQSGLSQIVGVDVVV